MADGTMKVIEEILIGESVIGKNGAINSVISIERPELGARKIYSINNEKHFVTAEHPFLSIEGWKSIDPLATLAENPNLQVGNLQLGDVIYTGQYTKKSIQWGSVIVNRIEAAYADPNLSVYNLILDGNNTYIANGFIVHNKGGDD